MMASPRFTCHETVTIRHVLTMSWLFRLARFGKLSGPWEAEDSYYAQKLNNVELRCFAFSKEEPTCHCCRGSKV
jgi:hypothetical protein